MANELNREKVKEYGLSTGASVAGVAAAQDFHPAPDGCKPADVLDGCRSVIVLGIPVPREAILKDDPVGFIDARNAVNEKVSAAVKSVEKWIRGKGYKARSVTGMSGKWVDEGGKKVQFGLISLKHAAELAGLGVIGRNYLLTNPRYGNLLWFGAVLTDAIITPDPKSEYRFCDHCGICAEMCPPKALDHYPGAFGKKQCDGTMFKKVNGKWEILCFMCRKACPHCLGTADGKDGL